ncbi:MAG TPA: hypothetical protein PKE55_05725 [Kiritimatiellia bacterium]|nr:hypothetical protein [Kiritimatiellia bacterium]
MKAKIIVGGLAVLLLVLLAIPRLFPDEPALIRKAFREVVRLVEKNEPLNPLQIAARLNQLEDFIAEDVDIRLGRNLPDLKGWSQLQRYAALALQHAIAIRIRIHGTELTPQPGQAWSMHAVLEVRADTRGMWESGFTELEIIWTRRGSDWVIQSARTLSSIAHPADSF